MGPITYRQPSTYHFVRHQAGRPKPCGELSERALGFFNELCDAFEANGAGAICDGPGITRYAMALDDWLTESASLRDEGYVIESGLHKAKVRNPRQAVVKSLAEDLAKAERQFGMNPEARGKLKGYQLRREEPEED